MHVENATGKFEKDWLRGLQRVFSSVSIYCAGELDMDQVMVEDGKNDSSFAVSKNQHENLWFQKVLQVFSFSLSEWIPPLSSSTFPSYCAEKLVS